MKVISRFLNLKNHLKGTFFKDPTGTILEACGSRRGKLVLLETASEVAR
jgi:hypothetical protein